MRQVARSREQLQAVEPGICMSHGTTGRLRHAVLEHVFMPVAWAACRTTSSAARVKSTLRTRGVNRISS
jgi:hypothetical protein